MNIIFEDDQVLVVDKPAGLVVNRSETIKEETLQDQLARYFKLGKSLGIGDRAGIVHRLDRETSGLLVVAKTQEAFDFLQKQFAERKVEKEYIALVHGHVRDRSGSIESKIGRIGKFGKFGVVQARLVATNPSRVWVGKEAKTDFEVEGYYTFKKELFGIVLGSDPQKETVFLKGPTLSKSRVNFLKNHAQDYTLLRLFPKTGRTHQIRVHLKSIGYPVVSDLIYAPHKLLKFDLLWCPRLFLHATFIEFKLPLTKQGVSFRSDLPSDLKNAMLYLATSD